VLGGFLCRLFLWGEKIMAYRKNFEDFRDYFSYTRRMTEAQKSLVCKHIPKRIMNKFDKQMLDEGWIDLVSRDMIDRILDYYTKQSNIDWLAIRFKAMHGKSVFIPTLIYHQFVQSLVDFAPQHTHYCIEGLSIIPQKENPAVSLVVYSRNKPSTVAQDQQQGF
jgi:hypothetical protein